MRTRHAVNHSTMERKSEMLSDILYEALDGIEHYQRSMPNIYDSNKHHIECVKREMFRLLQCYDTIPGMGYVFERAVDDTEPTTEKKALDMDERLSAIIAALSKIPVDVLTPEQVARLTPERLAKLTLEQFAKLTPEQVAELVLGKVKS